MVLIEGNVVAEANPATASLQGQVIDPTEWFESERPDRRPVEEDDGPTEDQGNEETNQ